MDSHAAPARLQTVDIVERFERCDQWSVKRPAVNQAAQRSREFAPSRDARRSSATLPSPAHLPRPSYDAYLTSLITPTDVQYLPDADTARRIVELG